MGSQYLVPIFALGFDTVQNPSRSYLILHKVETIEYQVHLPPCIRKCIKKYLANCQKVNNIYLNYYLIAIIRGDKLYKTCRHLIDYFNTILELFYIISK